MTVLAPQSRQNLLARLAAGDGPAEIAKGEQIESMFKPRMKRTADTAYTVTAEDAGVLFLFTSADAITVTLPDGLGAGFMCSFLPLGAGTITFTGADAGGTTSGGQNTLASALVLDDLSWILFGSVA